LHQLEEENNNNYKTQWLASLLYMLVSCSSSGEVKTHTCIETGLSGHNELGDAGDLFNGTTPGEETVAK
jgi:hypothetical protein